MKPAIVTNIILLALMISVSSFASSSDEEFIIQDEMRPLQEDLILHSIEFEVEEFLGHGFFGAVWKVRPKNPGMMAKIPGFEGFSELIIKVPISPIYREKLDDDQKYLEVLHSKGLQKDYKSQYSDNKRALFKTYIQGLTFKNWVTYLKENKRKQELLTQLEIYRNRAWILESVFFSFMQNRIKRDAIEVELKEIGERHADIGVLENEEIYNALTALQKKLTEACIAIYDHH